MFLNIILQFLTVLWSFKPIIVNQMLRNKRLWSNVTSFLQHQIPFFTARRPYYTVQQFSNFQPIQLGAPMHPGSLSSLFLLPFPKRSNWVGIWIHSSSYLFTIFSQNSFMYFIFCGSNCRPSFTTENIFLLLHITWNAEKRFRSVLPPCIPVSLLLYR